MPITLGVEHADHGDGQVAKKAWTPTLDTLHEGGVTHIITAVDQKTLAMSRFIGSLGDGQVLQTKMMAPPSSPSLTRISVIGRAQKYQCPRNILKLAWSTTKVGMSSKFHVHSLPCLRLCQVRALKRVFENRMETHENVA